MKTFKMLEFFAFLPSPCWLTKWRILFSRVLFHPMVGNLSEIFFSMKKTLTLFTLKNLCAACFPGGSEVKASACNVGDLGSIPGSGRSPGEGNGNPLQYSCLENGWRSLVGYSPWGRKKLDTTQRLNFFFVLSLSPASLEVITSLIKNNFSVFSLNPIALASSWTSVYQLAPQSCTFIISFKIQTPQFLSHLVFQNIILLVPLDPSQFSNKHCFFHSPLNCECASLCLTLSCICCPWLAPLFLSAFPYPEPRHWYHLWANGSPTFISNLL